MTTVRVTLLGTGAALLDPDRAQSGLLLTVGGERHYLIDCGSGIARRLVQAGVSPSEVGTVLLTHLHFDHVADLPAFTIGGWMLNRPGAYRLFGPPGTAAMVGRLFEGGAFEVDIRARGQYPLRQKNLAALRPEVTEYAEGVILDDGVVRVTAALVDHIPREITLCFGFRIEVAGRVVAVSGDTVPVPAMAELARGADLLVHECTFPEAFLEHRRRTGVGTAAHTSPTELGRLAAEAGVKLLVPTHFGHFDTTSAVLRRVAAAHLPPELAGPHQVGVLLEDIRRFYPGPVLAPRDLMVIDL